MAKPRNIKIAKPEPGKVFRLPAHGFKIYGNEVQALPEGQDDWPDYIEDAVHNKALAWTDDDPHPDTWTNNDIQGQMRVKPSENIWRNTRAVADRTFQIQPLVTAPAGGMPQTPAAGTGSSVASLEPVAPPPTPPGGESSRAPEGAAPDGAADDDGEPPDGTREPGTKRKTHTAAKDSGA